MILHFHAMDKTNKAMAKGTTLYSNSRESKQNAAVSLIDIGQKMETHKMYHTPV
jgi:hypothetical protein